MPKPKADLSGRSTINTSFTLDSVTMEAAREVAAEKGFSNSFSAYIVSLIKADLKRPKPKRAARKPKARSHGGDGGSSPDTDNDLGMQIATKVLKPGPSDPKQ